MIQKSVIMTFPRAVADKPMISQLIRKCDIEVNILQAFITPEQDGHMFAILTGEHGNVGRALEFLRDNGVRTVLPIKNLVRDDKLCVHCGACVGQCPSGAFAVEEITANVIFYPERCIACELCIPACSYGAIESIGDHLKKTGEL